MYFSIEDAVLINLCWLCNCVWSGHIMIAHDTTQSTHVLTEYTTITIQIIFYPAYNIQGQDYHFAQELFSMLRVQYDLYLPIIDWSRENSE